MIDIHCHIIPNVDDGASSLDESLTMARMAVGDGIREIVATPHTLDGVNENTTSEVLTAVDDLRQTFKIEGIPLRLHAGSEIHVTSQVSRKIKTGEACTLNNQGKYALLELPSQSIPGGFKEELFELKLSGITPIIAHPERNVRFQNDPGLLMDFIRMGALAQLTAMSLLGDFGPLVRNSARLFLENRLVQLIGSDAHSANSRPPLLCQAVEKAAEVLGSLQEAESMVTDRPAAVLAGESFDCPEPSNGRRQTSPNPFKRFGRLWRTCLHFT